MGPITTWPAVCLQGFQMDSGPAGKAGAGRRQAGHVAVATTAFCVAVFAVAFAGSSTGKGRQVGLVGLNIASLEVQASTALPIVAKARTEDLASADAFGSSVPPRQRGNAGVVYGNDDNGDDVELDPAPIAARTQALYDTPGINSAGGGVITPVQRATVRPAVSAPCSTCHSVQTLY